MNGKFQWMRGNKAAKEPTFTPQYSYVPDVVYTETRSKAQGMNSPVN